MKSVRVDFRNIIPPFLLGIIFLFAFYPAFFEFVPFISNYDILINMLIICGIFFYYLRYQRVKPILFFVLLFIIGQVISTALNHVDLKTSLWGRGVLLLAMCGGIQWGYNYNEKLFMKTIYILFYGLLVINLATIFLFPGGMFENQSGIKEYNFFLGNYNVFVIYFYMAAITGYLYTKKYRKKISIDYIGLWLIILITFYKMRSATSIVGIILLLLYAVFLNHKELNLLLNLNSYTVLNTAFFFTVVWHSSDGKLLEKITNVLKRDITFSGRTIIWSSVKPFVQEKWLLGNGLETQEVIFEKLSPVQAVHAHNLYLDILYKNGVLGLIIIAILFAMLAFKLRKLADQRIRYFLETFIGVFMLMCQFEAYSIKFIFFMLIFLYVYACRNKKRIQGR